MIFSFLVVLSGLVLFCIKRKHLLLMLMSLELMVLGVYMGLFGMASLSMDLFFGMVFLTFSVCEGGLGLSILVSMIRTHGNDYFQSFNLLW
uniref:NADH-ubiquinone oxidoreductase chain 4L n=1 Tax=Tenebrionoidea sp. 17 KM-2017 TaxID=2219472 RepID=A0A346RKI0_9CUCU|nr:NADH dehydrogenase subunit 4L [Tenebrionoidea sp. 17 KM-2017]